MAGRSPIVGLSSLETWFIEITESGGSANYEPWQNLCCVCTPIDEANFSALLSEISEIRGKYNQDSAAIIIGTTEYI